MLPETNIPGFGAKLRTESYFTAVNGILRTLRPLATLKVMADHLNSKGITSPSGLTWNRFRVSAYLRNNSIAI